MKVIMPKGFIVCGLVEMRGDDWVSSESEDVQLYISAYSPFDAQERAEARICKTNGLHPTWDYFEWADPPTITEASSLNNRRSQ